MTSETIYGIAEAIAPTFERRRAEVEELLTPVREWLLRELAPREATFMQRGHLPPPEPPPAPGPFSMASAERTTQLLRGAAFADVRCEEVPVRFAVPDVDEYLAFIADTAGPIALVLRRLADADRAQVRAEVKDSLGRFTTGTAMSSPTWRCARRRGDRRGAQRARGE